MSLGPSFACDERRSRRWFGSWQARGLAPNASDLALEQVRDEDREEHERLDQSETENHRRLNARRSARVTADTFERGRRRAPLTKTATEHRQADREARTERGHRRASGCAGTCSGLLG